jgi:hypothetical protein
MNAGNLPSQETYSYKRAAGDWLPEVARFGYKGNNITGKGRIELFSLFFIDIIKVTEVQYAILIIHMNRLTVEPLNIMALKQIIMSHSRLMSDLEKQMHKQQLRVHSQ